MSAENYWLWIDGKHDGPYTVPQIDRMCEPYEDPFPEELDEGERAEESEPITGETLYYSDRLESWQPLKLLPKNEWGNTCEDRLAGYEEAGVEWVQYLASGTDSDCPRCLEMNEKIILRGQATELPIEGCTCRPWPKSIWIAVKGPAKS